MLNRPFAALLPRAATMLLLALLATACSNDDDTDSSPTAPNQVVFTQAGLYPEGVAYDAAGQRFLVSSQTRGAVGQVKDDGTYTVFADDPALVSTIGMRIDENRRQLLVAVSDPGYNPTRTSAATQRKLAGLAIFNLTNGQRVAYLDLAALRPNQNHFANDIAVDGQGNIYVTDSFSPIIYKIDTQGTASVFLENAQLGAPAGAFGLNGIAYHPDGYLLVAKSNEGALFKVPVANPAGFTKVTTTQNLMGADGLLLQDNNTLQVVTNAQARVYRLASTDGWGSATVSGTFTTPPQYPTTLARREGADSYVLYSNLNALQANQNPPVADFSITQVKF
ncbi:gluconolaconase [Hymenobacter sediminis]|uniref:SMP-30/gluconolactonase/LRE family protein n=1 Tax=Hymenobacter sediminis TaxID=2218621 RepID=UPI000DA6DA6C|nr:SMP-30/gluconolactonase/LRE family protein [Hymenobacter sediminis]RPD47717.1 gluconolaconase [Hymenobacter sediminis]